jgi:hypothetical protein
MGTAGDIGVADDASFLVVVSTIMTPGADRKNKRLT